MDDRIKKLILRFYTKRGHPMVSAVFKTEHGEIQVLDTELDCREITVDLDEDNSEVN